MRDKGNFVELINQREKSIKKLKDAMSSGLAKKDRFEDIKGSIFISSIDIAQAMYSNGAAKTEIQSAVLACIPALEDGFKFDGGFGDYDLLIWLLSLSILCDIDSDEFSRITTILNRDKANDALLSFIIQSKDPAWPSSTERALQEHPYAKALNLNDASDIKKYLDTVWYQGHSDAAWYDTHLNKAVNCYSGYWAWEVAALVKIKGIDDADLKDQKYYPYDAVHW